MNPRAPCNHIRFIIFHVIIRIRTNFDKSTPVTNLEKQHTSFGEAEGLSCAVSLLSFLCVQRISGCSDPNWRSPSYAGSSKSCIYPLSVALPNVGQFHHLVENYECNIGQLGVFLVIYRN